MFYPEVKPHMSPSALDTWIHNRSGFIKSYFEGVKAPETAAMNGGKRIHALIEAGAIKAKHCYEINEREITITIDGAPAKFMGIPDSRQESIRAGKIRFVDYKSGKENGWKDKLPSDIKMKATAYLVWKATGKPKVVEGWVEYIPTEWDSVTKEIVPIEGAQTEPIGIVYSSLALQQFEQVIVKAMADVNEEYEKWQNSADFVSKEDMEEYAELKKKKDELEGKMKEIGERIMGQLDFGGKSTLQTPLGTFYITERKTFEYPGDLEFKVGKSKYTIDEYEEIGSAAKAAQKNFELHNEPKSISKSMGFRAPKEK